MSAMLHVLNVGPQVTVQDMGRKGLLAQGVTRGGAADQRALVEAGALLRQDCGLAVLEMVGMGGSFRADIDTVIALTGGEMVADMDGTALRWNATHAFPAGATLTLGAVKTGVYGYLAIAGGFDVPCQMGARATHLNAGIGMALKAGDSLPLAGAVHQEPGLCLASDRRFSGGDIHIVSSAQTDAFASSTLDRFQETLFARDPRGNRQGVRLASDGEGFFAEGGLSIVSEVITEGDIQITGDGAPYVLMCECQTTGGYPRIGTVLPCDLPRVAQAPVGATLRFQFLSMEDARAREQTARLELDRLASQVAPVVRDPGAIQDLLGYQLIDGVISATDDPFAHTGEHDGISRS